MRPGAPSSRRTGIVMWQASLFPALSKESFIARRSSCPRLAVDAPAAGSGERVAAVPCLGKRVGTEARGDLGGHDVVDHLGRVPLVEVVDELRALVAQIATVLE